MSLFAVINNKTYTSTIELTGGRIKRTDREGDVVANVYYALADICDKALEDDKPVVYVSRFQFDMIKTKEYNYWMETCAFKNGTALTIEQMDAVTSFLMYSGSGISFRNIDKYTTSDIPKVDHELGLLIGEVVTARTDWNKKETVVVEKEIIAPATAELTANKSIMEGLKGFSINAKSEPDRLTTLFTELTIGEVPAKIQGFTPDVIKDTDDDDFDMDEIRKFMQEEPVMKVTEDVKITVMATPVVVHELVAPVVPKSVPNAVSITVSDVKPQPVVNVVPEVKKTSPVGVSIRLDNVMPSHGSNVVTINLDDQKKRVSSKNTPTEVSIRLEGDNIPSFFMDPFEGLDESYLIDEPSASVPSVGASRSSSPSAQAGLLAGAKISFVSALPERKASPDTSVPASAFFSALSKMTARK